MRLQDTYRMMKIYRCKCGHGYTSYARLRKHIVKDHRGDDSYDRGVRIGAIRRKG